MIVFTGRFEYTIDDKGRLSVPSRMRDQIQKDGQALALFVTRGRKGQLSAYAEREYQQLVGELGAREDDAAGEALRVFTSETEECPIDSQGRVMLSARLRSLASITRDVVIVGVSKRLEIWSKAQYEKYQGENAARIDAAAGAIKGRADLI